jgi:hypothetical protein
MSPQISKRRSLDAVINEPVVVVIFADKVIIVNSAGQVIEREIANHSKDDYEDDFQPGDSA